ncbi:hypothetical protein LJB89_00605 [Tyzzerella sp. OttesenSCG-928-J15]|nr:hypothetical protein [Tyzzerella sp. OttesenSCG-928-J15]
MENAHLAHEEVRRIFKKIGIDDYFDRLSLSRIDYAFDIFLEDQSMVETYIQLMKRGNMPNGLLLKLFWHDTQHRSIPYRDSLYLKNNAVTINSYNKYEELKNKAKHFVDCERAIGILRLEVQCNGRKVEELEKKYGIDRYNPTDFFDEEIAREIVMSYVAKVTKLGAYHSLDNARCIINESRFNDRQKTELINFIEEVNSSRSLDKVKRSESYTPYQFRTRLKRLDELNINPVTIPFRWGYDYLSNLLTYIEQ